MLFRGLMVTSLSGSMDGIVASHNRGGPYFRSRTIPVDPNTVNQGYCRAAMAAAASAWNALSDADRGLWLPYAQALSLTNRIGESISISARDAFFRQVLPRAIKNYALDTGAPFPDPYPPPLPIEDFPRPPSITITDATHFNLIWPSPMGWEHLAADDGNTGIIVHISKKRHTVINWFRGPYIPGFWLEADEDTPPTSPHACDITLSGPTVVPHFVTGNKYFYSIRLFQTNRSNGRAFLGSTIASF